MPGGKKSEEKYSMLRQAGLAATIPFLLVVSPVIGYFLGRFLDARLGTSFLWIVLMGLGFVAGAREVYKIIVRISREP